MYSHLDLSKSVQKPKFFLCKPNRKIIMPIKDTENESLYLKLKGVNRLNFDLPYQVQRHHELVDNKVIDLIKPDYLIKMLYGDMEEWFEVRTPNPNSDDVDRLRVSCFSVENKLRKHKIFGYKKDAVQINTVANHVLANTGWTLGDYPTNGDYRQFNVNTKTTLQMLNTISDTFDTLLHFDTVNKVVHFYSKDYFSTFKGLIISERKYLQTFLREHNDEEFCTRLHVFGEKGLTINRLNPTGATFIEDFSYYLYPFQRDDQGNVISSSDYMDDDLAIAILDYQELVDSKKSEYQNLLDQKSVLLDEMTTLENQMDILELDLAKLKDELFVLQDMGSDTTTKEQEIANKESEINDKQTEIDNKQAEINAVDSDIQTIRNQCDKSNNFTQAQLSELNEHYVNEGEFRDENIKDDNALYYKGLEELQERKVPSFKVKSNIVNFKEMITEQKNWDKLSLGSIIRVKKESMGQDIKSQVTEIEFNFGDKDIRLVQSNSADYMDTKDRMIKQLYLSQESAKLLEDKKGEWDSIEGEVTEYVDNQINDVNNSISEINKGFTKFASDGFISKDEANLLQNQYNQLESESQDLISVAENFNVATEKTGYSNSITNLNNALSGVVGQSEYPISLLSSKRTEISNALQDVQNKKSVLLNRMNESRGIDISGWGIISGGTINITNRQEYINTYATINGDQTNSTTGYLTQINMVDTSSLPSSVGYGQYYIGFPNFESFQDANSSDFDNFDAGKIFSIKWDSKDSTTLYNIELRTKTLGYWSYYYPTEVFDGMKFFNFQRPTGDISVSNITAMTKDNQKIVVSGKTFTNQVLGVGAYDLDGWMYKYLYVDNNRNIILKDAGTGGGWIEYPPDPSDSNAIRIGYILTGFGAESPDGELTTDRDVDDVTGVPIFKDKIYFDVRYRDERKVKVSSSGVELVDTPYGTNTVLMNLSPQQYETRYINIGKGRRSVDCSFTLANNSSSYDGQDIYNYGATLKVGRKSANNADGQGYPLWGSYTESDGNRGHFQQIRYDPTYGNYILSPKVWGKNYTLLQSADIMPDPNNPEELTLRLTFYNYHSSSMDGEFEIKINWHAL